VNRVSATVIRETLGTARAQLDDLQAELEAGTRQAEKIMDCAAALDAVTTERREAEQQLTILLRRTSELRASLREQRALMKQLRDSFDHLRRHVGRLG
jgi:predicted RNase H-like nuclease (RuvC/YqgF family)